MGTTGAGKSTSISYLTKEAVVVGYGIKSCARQILALPFYYDASISVSLMDMPGFDDTKLSDRSVLEELTAFLKPSQAGVAEVPNDREPHWRRTTPSRYISDMPHLQSQTPAKSLPATWAIGNQTRRILTVRLSRKI
ncbi:hypothetical protein BKA59DRAFT_80295 [Fusarium tricinctum]|uniref:G domain-containing protein n=1 Tax=Fusarium tricinctum TaxID=61284 RepID=A0A8K0WFE2_9HYPO|nr:hypothetical protein BKA59DRAFT_80295 [Fusarium tricinctum]